MRQILKFKDPNNLILLKQEYSGKIIYVDLLRVLEHVYHETHIIGIEEFAEKVKVSRIIILDLLQGNLETITFDDYIKIYKYFNTIRA